MSWDENDMQLALGAFDGKFDEVKAALEAGANVDGPPDHHFPPIVAATIADHAGMVDFLLEQGADPDRPVTKESTLTMSKIATTILGERALHIAARSGNVEIVRVLLEPDRAIPNATDNRGYTPLMATCESQHVCVEVVRYFANPNATDNRGYTPLMATCESQHVCVEVVRLLLEAGADPALAEEEQGGFIPLHLVALNEDTDLVDMLYSRAPATLNHCPTTHAATPLFLACGEGNERMVSKLLSLGAMQPMAPDDSNTCPLWTAVIQSFVGVVRVLVNEGGIRAVGGEMPLARALHRAVEIRPPIILRLLLTVDGEERRSEWANTYLQGFHLLHVGAGRCCPAAVSVLLEAGADEAARDSEGRIPRDVMELLCHSREDGVQRDRGEEVAIRRMLQRGPAYRARSWAWPSGEEAGAGGSGDGDTAAAASAVLSSPPVVNPLPVIGVRIYRPKEKSSRKFFVRLIGRYCAKD